jgi:hypothetical protein
MAKAVDGVRGSDSARIKTNTTKISSTTRPPADRTKTSLITPTNTTKISVTDTVIVTSLSQPTTMDMAMGVSLQKLFQQVLQLPSEQLCFYTEKDGYYYPAEYYRGYSGDYYRRPYGQEYAYQAYPYYGQEYQQYQARQYNGPEYYNRYSYAGQFRPYGSYNQNYYGYPYGGYSQNYGRGYYNREYNYQNQ